MEPAPPRSGGRARDGGDAPPLSGKDLGPYRLEALIGQGGMAQVYRARERATGRLVALKVLTEGKTRLPTFLERFEREWRVMQAHPWLGALTLFLLRSYDETPYRAILTAHEHHMKTDLSGYPRTVRPRELGIYSRIVAVADGFDAATTRRSYQTVPIEPDQVLREMWQNPKRGYDIILVKALINLIGIYPVGTCVILDSFEVAIVAGPNGEGRSRGAGAKGQSYSTGKS